MRAAPARMAISSRPSRWRSLTKAAFLQDPKKKTEVFARFSTVAGGAGSGDLPRDVRGFAVKFYTEEGNFDLVGNNIPVFFIQDAIKFPDLIHSVKMEPDRGYPQAASAHDTFWDFASLMPESMHMLTWVMSDRAIPRSLRMIEGFGIHTFRLINAKGESTFVKFHWRPVLGAASVRLGRGREDQRRRSGFPSPRPVRGDRARAISPNGNSASRRSTRRPRTAFDFDVLDPTKLIPEEIVPLEVIGKMVLNRNVDNFFAETEQAAFHPGHVVAGHRLHQRSAAAGAAVLLHRHAAAAARRPELPRAGDQPAALPDAQLSSATASSGRTCRPAASPTSRTASIRPARARAPSAASAPSRRRTRKTSRATSCASGRKASPTTTARRGCISARWRSRSSATSSAAFAFELGKVETIAIRTRMLGHLMIIDEALGAGVEQALGMEGTADAITPARDPIDMDLSPTLSLIKKAEPTLTGRKVAALVTDGVDDAVLDALRKAVEKEGAAARDRRAEDRRRHHREGQEAAGRSSAFGRAVGVVRRGRAAAFGRGRGVARQ